VTPLVNPQPPRPAPVEVLDVTGSEQHPRVALAVSDNLLRIAIESILRLENIPVVDGERCRLVLTDDLQREGKGVILLSDESPAEAYAAVTAFISGRVSAIASIRQPEAIAVVIKAACEQLAVLPQSLLAAAFHAPRLGDRQVRVLALVIQGLSNAAIGERLSLSEASVKRDVSSLLRTFDCTTRGELVARAVNVGYSGTSRSS
jgi:DNA-binding CsgD family transcriptional regulator